MARSHAFKEFRKLKMKTDDPYKLVKKLDVIYSRFKNDNIIINLTSLKTLTTQDVVEFLNISNQHRKAKQSFVIVTDKIKLEEVEVVNICIFSYLNNRLSLQDVF